MNLCKVVTSANVLALILMPLTAIADQEEPVELKAAVFGFYQQIAAGDFEKALSHMDVGSRGYLSFGVLSEIPNEAARQFVIAKYSQAYQQGARVLLMPRYYDEARYDDMAITTFLTQGTIQHSGDDKPEEVVQRVTLVWKATDDGWKIVHWHSSKSIPADDNE